MSTRLPSLRRPPLLFAHRGARAYAPENTIEAFELALRLGATGLETDVWRTADGTVVLDHDGLHRRWLPRRWIRELPPSLWVQRKECRNVRWWHVDNWRPGNRRRVAT